MKNFGPPAILCLVYFIITIPVDSWADTLEVSSDSVFSRDTIGESAEIDSGAAVDSLGLPGDANPPDSLAVSDSTEIDSAVVASTIERIASAEREVEDTVIEDFSGSERSEGVSYQSFSSEVQSDKSSWLRRIGAFSSRLFSFAGNLPSIVFLRTNGWKIGIFAISIAVIFCTIMFFRRRDEERRFMTTTRLSVMDKEVQRACKHMEKYFDDPNLDLESLCRSLVTGPAFMEALFQREMGMRVEEFLLHVRINRARSIMKKDPAVAMDELSRSVGISDPGNLEEAFRRLVGVSLEEYRSRTAEYTTS